MYFSKNTPTMTSGAMPAVEIAAITHQLMPCEPVWLATITGSVLASVLVRSAAKKYSFQVSDQREDEGRDHTGQRDRHDDAEEGAPRRQPVDQRRLVELDRDRVELVPHDPDDDRQHRQRVDQDQAERRVEEGELAVENEEGKGEDDRRQDQLRDEEEEDVARCCASARSGSGSG